MTPFTAKSKGAFKMNFDTAYADYVDDTGVDQIKALEKDLGKTLLAYYTPPKPADISNAQLKKISELENKLCVRLVAYDKH